MQLGASLVGAAPFSIFILYLTPGQSISNPRIDLVFPEYTGNSTRRIYFSFYLSSD